MAADPRDWNDYRQAEAFLYWWEHVAPDLGIDPDDDEEVLTSFTAWSQDEVTGDSTSAKKRDLYQRLADNGHDVIARLPEMIRGGVTSAGICLAV